jgi:hypothetical protein
LPSNTYQRNFGAKPKIAPLDAGFRHFLRGKANSTRGAHNRWDPLALLASSA